MAAASELTRSSALTERVSGASRQAVDISPPGHVERIVWSPARGATAAEIDLASASIGYALAEERRPLDVSADDRQREVRVPPGRRVLALALKGLNRIEDAGDGKTKDTPITHGGQGVRLVVATKDPRQQWTPVFAVPAVAAKKMQPALFLGASFDSGVLWLPELDARQVRLSLTTGDEPKDWEAQPIKLDSPVAATLGVPSADLKLTGPGGAVLWAFPGAMNSALPDAEVDLKAPLQAALTQALGAGKPLEMVLTLTGGAGCKAGFRLRGPNGWLVRKFPGVLATELSGAPVPLNLGELKESLADEEPGTVVGDLTVRYAGWRVLETFSDPVPTGAAVSGLVVGEAAVTRALAPAVFKGPPLARVGLIGRAPEACELSVQLVAMNGTVPGAALGPASMLKLDPSTHLGLHWLDFDPLAQPKVGAALQVRAGRGRFFWAGRDAPLVRLAVRDPDPGGRPVRLGASRLMAVAQDKATHRGHAFPAALFRSSAPALASELFLTVEVSDLQLKYRR